jgi:hypothetical protein
MYPTSVFGFLLILAAALCLFRPERRFVPVTLSLGILTLSSGALGTVIGIVMSFHYLPMVPDVNQRFTIAALGCAESLNNLVLALLLVTLSSMLAAVGAARAALTQRAPAAT